MIRAVTVLAIGGATIGLLAAQSPASPTFEVASVKRSAPDSQGISISGFHPTRFTARSAPLAALLVFAYALRSTEQVVGGPSWVRSERFDIVASSETNPMSELPAKLQALLIERFGLRARVETADGPIYVLRGGGAVSVLGPRLRRSTVDCQALLDAGQLRPEPVTQGALCTGRQSLAGRTRVLHATGLPMADLAKMLGFAAERDVIDQTGLLGGYDAELSWTPGVPAQERDGSQVSEGVSLFTAVREQLGLRLEAGRGPVTRLVIDSVERPTPD